MDVLRVFVRQPFTESGDKEKNLVQSALDVLRSLDGNPLKLDVSTGFEAQSSQTFRQTFERNQGIPFTPHNFRTSRLERLRNAHAMVIIRTGLSESGAFEVSYNVFAGGRAPMFFAVWNEAPIKTTLLRELGEISDATYVTFDDPSELEAPLREFILRAAAKQGIGIPAAIMDVNGTSDAFLPDSGPGAKVVYSPKAWYLGWLLPRHHFREKAHIPNHGQ